MGEAVLYHEADGTRCLDIGGSGGPGLRPGHRQGPRRDGRRRHPADLRRPDPRPVAGRGVVGARRGTRSTAGSPGCCAAACSARPRCPTRCRPKVDDAAALDHLRKWEAAGGPTLEQARAGHRRRRAAAGRRCRPTSASAGFDRPIDVDWRRTSYSALIRAAEETGGVTSEPELSARDDEVADELADDVDGRRRPRPSRRAARAVADGRPALRRGVRLAGPRGPRAGRPVRRRPRGRAAPARRGAARLVAGRHPDRRARGGPGAAAPHLARPARRRADPRRDRRCPTGCASSTSRSRWPAATSRRASRSPLADVGAPARRSTSPPTTRCGPTPPGCGPRASATSRCAATCPGSIDVVLRVPARRRPPLPRRRLQDQLAGPGRRTAHRGGLRPRPAGRGDAALRLPAPGAALRRRRAPLPALAPARLRPGAPPRRRALPLRARHVRARDARGATATPPASSPGSRRPRWSTALSDLLDGGADDPAEPSSSTTRTTRGSPRGAAGCCARFNEAGVLDAADVHVARRLCALAGEDEPLVALAVAFVVRAVRGGSVCVDLATVADGRPRPAVAGPGGLVRRAWPPARWSRRRPRCCASCDRTTPGSSTSTATGARRSRSTPTWSRGPPRRDGTRRDLARRRRSTGSSRRGLRRAARRGPGRAHPRHHGADRRARHRQDHHRRRPARAAAPSRRELAGEPPVRIALAAPTGKAAARLQQAVEAEVAKPARPPTGRGSPASAR